MFQTFMRRLVEEEKLLGPVECIYSPQGNKRILMEGVGSVVNNLFEVDRCDHVLVIWDVKPSWPTMGAKADYDKEIDIVTQALNDASVPSDRTTLVCIKYELESWLICDSRAFGMLPNGKGQTPANKKGWKEASPKNAASVMKEEIGLSMYLDYNDAHVLAEHVRFAKLATMPSFCLWFCTLFGLVPAKTKSPFCKCAPIADG